MPETMFLQTIESEGLAHLSYIVGHGGQAAVIDARRDVEVYLDIAQRHQCRITHLFETHRNEDYVTGSRDLQRRTGATIHHGRNLDWAFGQAVAEGDTFQLGDIRLGILETPGHTFESISITLADTGSSDAPVAVFTGDALFVGDVGRTDFYPDRAEEVAGLLYDSIFDKLLPLGDEVLLYPAHGAGSVCGSGMAPRNFSSLGHERKYNPALQVDDREAFIRRKLAEHHDKPPYFKQMEKYNQYGAPPLRELPHPQPVAPGAFAKAADDSAIVVDLREPEAFAGAFVPGSLNIPVDMIPAYAGYLLAYDRPILFVATRPADVTTAVHHLVRIGYDRLDGYLHGSLHAWETSGRVLASIGVTSARELKDQLGDPVTGPTVLDVRKIDEWQAGHLEGATHIFLGELPDRLDEIPADRPIVTFCGSGRRASIAASILHRHGLRDVSNNLGSMAACKAVECEIVNA